MQVADIFTFADYLASLQEFLVRPVHHFTVIYLSATHLVNRLVTFLLYLLYITFTDR